MKSSLKLFLPLVCAWVLASLNAFPIEPTKTLALWPGDAPGEVEGEVGEDSGGGGGGD